MHTHFPPATVSLRDGTPVRLRFLRPDDTERIKAFFYRLSPESIFYRLLEYRTTISDEEARWLCNVDGVTRVAIAATVGADADEAIIAVARYGLTEADNPTAGEAAVVVEDGYQRRGLGKVLVSRLVEYALAHGVRRFTATIHVNNEAILRFIQHSGFKVERKFNAGAWDVMIELQRPKQ
jgi:RimJ/RimL family protein N-acetyltransferase